MKPRVLAITCLAAGALLVSAAPGWAQVSPEPLADGVYARVEKYPNTLADHVRLDLAIKKSGVTTKALLLDQAEREAFLPVYEAYQQKWARLSSEREALLTDYIQRANNLDDATAKAMLAKCLALEEERMALLKQYAGELEQIVPATLAVKFIEAELQIQNLTDVQLSDRLPDFR